MRFPLKALFSRAGRQPLVMHKCICDAHTRFKVGQILKKAEQELSIVKMCSASK